MKERDKNHFSGHPLLSLVPNCRIKERPDGYILEDIANILYTPICTSWKEFDEKKLEMVELNMPAEVFAEEMKMNLMGFYYRLSRYPYWTPPIHRLACIIVSEYTMRESIGCLADYSLLPDETFHFTTDDPGEDIEDWSQIFLSLGRQLITNRPLTLWADVFALQILYSMKQGVQVMFQPCYAEMRRINPTTEHHQLRLRTISQLLMKDLNAYPLPYPERENGCYDLHVDT